MTHIAHAPRIFLLAAFAASLVACAPQGAPKNLELVDRGAAYQAQYRTPARRPTEFLQSEAMNAQACLPYRNDGMDKLSGLTPAPLMGEVLSRGDLVEIRIEDDEIFSGDYVVSRDGTLKLPFIAPIQAAGRTPANIESAIARSLQSGEFYVEAPRVAVLLTDFAPARVAVSGAVFEPRPVDIGGTPGDMIDARRQAARGASTESRNLTVALRSAGGVRPDADLSSVELHREGKVYRLDLRPVIEGHGFEDVILQTGDEIVVPSRQCFQEWLMVPSPISPPGITLFLSNLTQPSSSNASSAIGREAREVPYGTRFIQGVVNANCVGGARATSADRSAVLYSRNPISDVSVVMDRRIEDMRLRADRDDYDPFLLPGDSIACYDSAVTNLADIGRVLGVVGAGLLLN
jgi:protein involved in polysaccharide export with SLBB domain